jgi:hypothetical protein
MYSHNEDVMSRAAWPTTDELQDYLLATRIESATDSTLSGLLDLQGAIDAAVEDFEGATGYKPFLADSVAGSLSGNGETAVTRYFTPDMTDLLDLHAGLVWIESVAVGVSNTSDGTALDEDEDWYAMPENAATEEKPWSWIEFAAAQTGSRRSIAVRGIWGYSYYVPELAFQAVLARAAELLMPQIVTLMTSGLVRRRAGDEEEQYGDKPYVTQTAAWRSLFDRACQRFRHPMKGLA